MRYYISFHPFSFGFWIAYHSIKGVHYIDIMFPLFILTIEHVGKYDG